MDQQQIQRFIPLVIQASKAHRAAKQSACVALAQVTLTFVDDHVGQKNIYDIAQFVTKKLLTRRLLFRRTSYQKFPGPSRST